MKTSKTINQTVKKLNVLVAILVFILSFSVTNEASGTNTPGRYNLPDHLRPAFASMPIWRLQLRVKTSGVKNANTDNEVYVQLTPAKSSVYYLDRAGDDREKNKVNTYDILDPNIKTMRDIKMLKLMIKGTDGWCVQSVEILVNDINTPVFRKKFKTCQWLDGNDHEGPVMYIAGSKLRKHPGWRYTSKNKAIWLPPTIIERAKLEQMVESYVGHMMNTHPDMRKLEFGKKYGRAYVEAKKRDSDKLHFDLDLAYHKGVDFAVDVDFDLVVRCSNNKISLKAQSVKGKVNIPIVSSLVRLFKSNFAKMNMGNFNFGNANVPFCPSIKVTNAGDIVLRP